MSKLIYSVIASLDGFIEDASGDYDWAEPDDDVMAHAIAEDRPIGTYLYGRRMYEVMRYWEHEPDESSDLDREWAAHWREVTKVVYSRSLETAETARTRIERDFDPAAARRLVDEAAADVTIGGAELAGLALAAGVVDELQLYTVPIVVGDGKPWLPAGVGLELDLIEVEPFTSGFVFSRYRVASTRNRRE